MFHFWQIFPFSKNYLLLSYATFVRPFVCVNIYFRSNLVSNRPIDPKIGLNVRKIVIFRNSNCKLQIYAIFNFFAKKIICTVLTYLLT